MKLYGLELKEDHLKVDYTYLKQLGRALLMSNYTSKEVIDIWEKAINEESINAYLKTLSTTNSSESTREENFLTTTDESTIKVENNLLRLKMWIKEIGDLTESEIVDFSNTYSIPFSYYAPLLPNKNENRIPSEIYEILSKKVIGQEKAKKVIANSLYCHQLRISKTVDIPQNHVLLIGPSGSGKTLLASEAAKILNVPFIKIDAASLVQSGIIGSTISDYFAAVYNALDIPEKIESAVVYIDEFDKLSISYSSDRRRIQTELLSVIGESGELNLDIKKYEPPVKIITSNMLFIFSGAFVDLKFIKNKNNAIGFGANRQKIDIGKNDILLRKQIMEYGFIEEIVNRIQQIIKLKRLTKEELVSLIENSGASELKKYENYAKIHGKRFLFTSDFKKSLAKIAFETNMNGRAIKNILAEAMTDILIKCPLIEEEEIVIDKNYLTL